MKGLYRYSIIRFRPFSETGEFANVGVLALDIRFGRIGFELAPKRFARVKHFFDDQAHDAYQTLIDFLRIELSRATEYLPFNSDLRGQDLFNDITRPRESSVVFSEPRTMTSDLSLDEVIRGLFARYVKREFTNPETAENILTKDIRKALHKVGLKHFKQARIDDDVVPVSFPLAYDDGEFHAIRPLAFSQKNPLGVFDYGAHWRKRLGYLLDRRKIREKNVLLAVEGPRGDVDHSMREAYRLAIEELEQLPFELIHAEPNGAVNSKIIEFAQSVRDRQHYIIH